jgi:hypothetical protein
MTYIKRYMDPATAKGSEDGGSTRYTSQKFAAT